MKKYTVGVLGATGMVGQRYIDHLRCHPWFTVGFVAASPRSAGKTYAEALDGRYLIGADIPEAVAGLLVSDASDLSAARGKCDFVFSALEMDKEKIVALEEAYAAAGIPVVSNASANRWTADVPMLIPEINADHTAVIAAQRKNRDWDRGFIVVKPNCSLQSFASPLAALVKAGYPVSKMVITTLQAVSGAGYPGVASFDMIDNIVPYIGGEEEKTEKEILKILGRVEGGLIKSAASPLISATCTRVPVIDGHTASVSLEFGGSKKPSLAEIESIWANFSAEPQALALPSAPEHPIILRHENNRPQPKLDRESGGGMAVTVGRLREDPVFDIRFVALSHNTKRGAALGGILNAELLAAKGFFTDH